MKDEPRDSTRRTVVASMTGFLAASLFAGAPEANASETNTNGCECVSSKMVPAPISAKREQLRNTMHQLQCLQDILRSE